MIATHLKDADSKFNDFLSKLTEVGYFPEDKTSETYTKRYEEAKKVFVEKTTIALSTQYKDLGNAKMQEKHYDLAKKLYSESIRLHPTAVAYTNRGKSYDIVLDNEGAEEDYSKAIQMDPSYSKPYQPLIKILKKKHKERAQEVFNKMKTNVKDQKAIEEAEKELSKE